MRNRNWRIAFIALVVLSDFVLINSCFYLAINLRFPNLENVFHYWPPWLFVNIAFLILALVLGLYRDFIAGNIKSQRANFRKLTLFLALFTMSFLFMTKGHIFSRGVLVIFLMAQYVALETSHSLLNRLNTYLLNKGYNRKYVLIIGADYGALRFSEILTDTYGNYYKILGFIGSEPGDYHPDITPFIIGEYDTVEAIFGIYSIDEVFIISDSMEQNQYQSIRETCKTYRVPVKMIPPYAKKLIGKEKIRGVPGVPLTPFRKKQRGFLKRSIDLFFAISLFIIFAPLGLMIALLIKTSSKGPVFFKQKRALYKGGKEFWFYKFRTMNENAESQKEALWNKNGNNNVLFKLEDDPRITTIGKWLRKYSLDEIPQLINVLKSDMSLVGPRPLPVNDFIKLKNGKANYDWYSNRGKTKPGITGLWQISGRSDLSFEDMCLLDLYYIENQSVFFDMEIMLETVPVVFGGRGAY